MSKQQAIPHNAEAEEAVLGSLLIDPSMGYISVAPILEPGDFYIQKNAWVYDAVQTLNRRGVMPDFVTLCDELERRGQLKDVGGAAYLTKLINTVPSALRVEGYAHIVEQAAIRRRLILAASEVAKLAYDEEMDIGAVQAQAEEAVLNTRRNGVGDHAIPDVIETVYAQADERMNNPTDCPGLSTGLRPLDGLLGGLQTGFYILAARPSVGKTALALQIASNVAAAGERVMVFTLEMSPEQLVRRLACSWAEVSLRELLRGKLDPESYARFTRAVGEINEWPMSLHTGDVTPGVVRAKVQRELLRGDVALVIVDYLGLLSPDQQTLKRAETRNLELGGIARGLLLAANALDTPILSIHQLNRGVDARPDKRPMLSDLRESGQLEEHADVVLMLYREGYYDNGNGGVDNERANVMEVWARKNRLDGPSGERCELFWRGAMMRCYEMESGVVE